MIKIFNAKKLKNSIKPISIAIISAIVTELLLTVLFSLVYVKADFSTEVFQPVTYLILILSAFVGGYVIGLIMGEKGLKNATIVFIAYILINLIVAAIISKINFNINTILKLLSALIAALMGGILSVNLKAKRRI